MIPPSSPGHLIEALPLWGEQVSMDTDAPGARPKDGHPPGVAAELCHAHLDQDEPAEEHLQPAQSLQLVLEAEVAGQVGTPREGKEAQGSQAVLDHCKHHSLG